MPNSPDPYPRDNDSNQPTNVNEPCPLKLNPKIGERKVEQLCAELTDIIFYYSMNNKKPSTRISRIIYNHVLCEIINAEMWCKKYLTLNE